MRNIDKVSVFLLFLCGCAMGDYIPPLLSGDIYSLDSQICARTSDGNVISNYVLFEGVRGDKIKMAIMAGKSNVLCIDSEGLLEGVTYIGHYAAIKNGKKKYYGFNIMKNNGVVFKMNDDNKYTPLP